MVIARICPEKDRLFRFLESGRIFHGGSVIAPLQGKIKVEYDFGLFQDGLVDLLPELREGIALFQGILVVVAGQEETVLQKLLFSSRRGILQLSVVFYEGPDFVQVLVHLPGAQGKIGPEDLFVPLVSLACQKIQGRPQKALLYPFLFRAGHIVRGRVVEAVSFQVQGPSAAASRSRLIEDLLLVREDRRIRQDFQKKAAAPFLCQGVSLHAALDHIEARQADHFLAGGQKPFHGLLQGLFPLHLQKVNDMVPGVFVFQAQMPLQLQIVLFGQGKALQDLPGRIPGHGFLVCRSGQKGVPLDRGPGIVQEDAEIIAPCIIVGVGDVSQSPADLVDQVLVLKGIGRQGHPLDQAALFQADPVPGEDQGSKLLLFLFHLTCQVVEDLIKAPCLLFVLIEIRKLQGQVEGFFFRQVVSVRSVL